MCASRAKGFSLFRLILCKLKKLPFYYCAQTRRSIFDAVPHNLRSQIEVGLARYAKQDLQGYEHILNPTHLRQKPKLVVSGISNIPAESLTSAFSLSPIYITARLSCNELVLRCLKNKTVPSDGKQSRKRSREPQ